MSLQLVSKGGCGEEPLEEQPAGGEAFGKRMCCLDIGQTYDDNPDSRCWYLVLDLHLSRSSTIWDNSAAIPIRIVRALPTARPPQIRQPQLILCKRRTLDRPMNVLDPLRSGYDITPATDIASASASFCCGLCGCEARCDAAGKVLRERAIEIGQDEAVGGCAEAELEEGGRVLH